VCLFSECVVPSTLRLSCGNQSQTEAIFINALDEVAKSFVEVKIAKFYQLRKYVARTID